MRRHFPIRLLFALALLCGLAGAARASCPSTGKAAGFTHCYYVDPVGGSDSNDGLSEASGHPWKHGPGMIGAVSGGDGGCSANCATLLATLNSSGGAGYAIVYKGGVVAPYTMFPFNETVAGTSTTTTNGYGCAGTGCYIPVTVDPTWNLGTVTAVYSNYDISCTGSTPVTVAISGGGGSGATATATMINSSGGTQFAGGLYLVAYYTVTAPGSGYTSNPTVTISGGTGCTAILPPGTSAPLALADITRTVWDMGSGSSFVWDSTVNSCSGTPSLQVGIITSACGSGAASHTLVDSIELRDLDFNNSGCQSTTCSEPIIFRFASQPFVTFNNIYLHDIFSYSQTVAGSDGSVFLTVGYGGSALASTGEISNSFVENGQAAYPCAPSGSGPLVTVCGYAGEGALNAPYNHNNRISFNTYQIAAATSSGYGNLVENNVWWGTTAQPYTVGGHTNEAYLQNNGLYHTTVANNLYSDNDAGAFSQIETSTSGSQYDLVNNTCPQFCGYGASFVLDTSGNTGQTFTLNVINNAWMVEGAGVVQDACFNMGNAGSSTGIALNLYNNICGTTQSLNPWYYGTGGQQPHTINGITSPTNSTPTPYNYVVTPTSLISNGYTLANLLNPTSASSPTQGSVFGGTNLTSLCSGQLAVLCGANANPAAIYTPVTQPASGSTWSAGPQIFVQTVTNPPAPTPQSLLITFTLPAQIGTATNPTTGVMAGSTTLNDLFVPPLKTTVTIPAQTITLKCSGCSVVKLSTK